MRRDGVIAGQLEKRQFSLFGGPGTDRRFLRPWQVGRADVHPAVCGIHAGHVHSVAGRACAFDGIAKTYRVEMHRVFDPEGAEKENVVAARDRFAKCILSVSFLVAGARKSFHLSPIGNTKFVMLFPRTPVRARGQCGRAQCRRSTRFGQVAGFEVETLRGIDLAFEAR